MSIEGSDLQALMTMIKEEHERSRTETLAAVKKLISEHEDSEVERLKSALSQEIHETHTEEHKFIRTWMKRMDSMGDGFFGSLGKGIAAIIFIGFAAAALATIGKQGGAG